MQIVDVAEALSWDRFRFEAIERELLLEKLGPLRKVGFHRDIRTKLNLHLLAWFWRRHDTPNLPGRIRGQL